MVKVKISVKDGKSCEKVLKVEVPTERIQAEYKAFYRSVASQAKVPGFRPGKVPQNVLEMHYGAQAKESVLKELITDSYREAVQEQSIEPLGYPEVDKVDFKEDRLSYQAIVEVRPRVKLSRITGLKAKKEEAVVKDSEVEDSLKRVQDSMAQYKAVEDRSSQMGDFLIADYVCTCGEAEVDKREGDWLELSEEREMFQGFAKQLVGVKAEDKKEVKIELPKDYAKKEFAGKPVIFEVSIKEVKAKSLPPIDDELAKSVGTDFKNLEELKKKIREDLLVAKERESETNYEKALLDELIKHNKIDLPARLIKRREDQMVDDTLRHYTQQGLPEEVAKDMKEKLKKDVEPEAKRQVHLAFLLEEIAQQQNFTVADEDRQAKFAALAEQVRQPLEAITSYYKDPERLLALDDQIRNEKAIDYIKQNAKRK